MCLELNRVTTGKPLILQGGAIKDLSGFGSKCSGPVRLHGDTDVSVCSSMVFTGPVGGPGGFRLLGEAKGTISLQGTNTYGGTTRLEEGTLEVSSSLYGNNPALWTPASSAPARMVVTGETKTLTLDDILLGDIWLLGGQGNMEHPIPRTEAGTRKSFPPTIRRSAS